MRVLHRHCHSLVCLSVCVQATQMAFPLVDERAVYLTAGAVLPSVLASLLQSLLNDDFNTCYAVLHKVCLIDRV